MSLCHSSRDGTSMSSKFLTILGELSIISKIAPRWGQIDKSYLALRRAKLRKSSKVELIRANSDFEGVEMVPVRPVLA